MRVLFLISFIISTIHWANARQPAVLPGFALSIDKQNENLPRPKNFQGYSFKEVPKKNNQVIQDNLNQLSKSGPQSISIYLTIFALLFPFGLWMINNRSLKDENDIINKNLDQNDNVIPLNKNQTENQDNINSEDDIDDQKKAS